MPPYWGLLGVRPQFQLTRFTITQWTPHGFATADSAIAFLSCGVAFLAAAIPTKLVAFYAIAPVFIALGLAFLVKARKGRNGALRAEA
jgi:hypothetical protein